MKSFLQNRIIHPFIIFLILFCFPISTFAVMYQPGETLNPSCLPTDISCGVVVVVGSGTIGQVPYYSSAGSSVTATSSLFLDDSGYFGIGTTSPTDDVHIYINKEENSLLTLENNNGSWASGLTLKTPGKSWLVAGWGTGVENSFIIQDLTAGQNRLVITNTGNVGLGTTSPYAKLSVEGASVLGNSATAGYFVATSTTATSTFAGSVGIGPDYLVNGMRIPVNGLGVTNGIVSGGAAHPGYIELLDGGGNSITKLSATGSSYIGLPTSGSFKLGIASSSPWALLSVDTSSIAGPSFMVGSTTRTDLIITNGGNIGIGTTSPYARLSIVGQTVSEYFTSTSTTNASNFRKVNITDAGGSNGMLNISDGTKQLTLGYYNDATRIITSNGIISFGDGAHNDTTLNVIDSAGSTSFSTNGSRMYTGVDIKAGIGTTTPTARLAVKGEEGSSLNRLFVLSDDANRERLTVLNNGSIGIGTTSPSSTLNVDAVMYSSVPSISTSLNICEGDCSATYDVGVYLAYTIYPYKIVNGLKQFGSLVSTTTPIINIAIANTSITLDISVPSGADGVRVFRIVEGISNSGTGYFDANSSGSYEDGNNIIGVTWLPDYYLSSPFGDGDTNYYKSAAIFSNGNVGIGTTSPTGKLNIQTNQTINDLSVYDLDMQGYVFQVNSWNRSVSFGNYARITADAGDDTYFLAGGEGKFGIATTSPWKTFSVNGTVSFAGLTGASGSSPNALCLDANNQVVVNNAQTCTVSSQRYKNSITELSSGLETINKLKPVSFKYNGNDTEHVGFIAEDVEKVDPRLMFYDASSTPQGVRYEEMTAVLAKAIQELNTKVNNISNLPSTTNNLASTISSLSEWVGEKITATVGVFTNLKTENLEMKDKLTGQIYCVTIENGEWQKKQGDCASQSLPGNAPLNTSNNDTVIDTPVIPIVDDTATSTEPISTTTPEQINNTDIVTDIVILDQNASSTEIIN